MKEATTILLGIAVSGIAFAGLLLYGRAKKLESMGKDDPTAPIPTPGVTPVGPFPILQVGTNVLLDSKAAGLPEPFSAFPQVPATVDGILSDPFAVSVAVGVKGVSSFSGTVPRSSIVRILSPPLPPGVLLT